MDAYDEIVSVRQNVKFSTVPARTPGTGWPDIMSMKPGVIYCSFDQKAQTAIYTFRIQEQPKFICVEIAIDELGGSRIGDISFYYGTMDEASVNRNKVGGRPRMSTMAANLGSLAASSYILGTVVRCINEFADEHNCDWFGFYGIREEEPISGPSSPDLSPRSRIYLTMLRKFGISNILTDEKDPNFFIFAPHSQKPSARMLNALDGTYGRKLYKMADVKRAAGTRVLTEDGAVAAGGTPGPGAVGSVTAPSTGAASSSASGPIMSSTFTPKNLVGTAWTRGDLFYGRKKKKFSQAINDLKGSGAGTSHVMQWPNDYKPGENENPGHIPRPDMIRSGNSSRLSFTGSVMRRAIPKNFL